MPSKCCHVTTVCSVSVARVTSCAQVCLEPRMLLLADALKQGMEKEQQSIHQEAMEEFARVGYSPQMVATLLHLSLCHRGH